MSHSLIEHPNPRTFYNVVIHHLLKAEAECCAHIGLVGRMARDGYAPLSEDELEQPNLWTIQSGPDIDLVAIQTLKDSMIVTRGSIPAMECLANALHARRWTGNFLVGVTPSVDALIRQYATLSGRSCKIAVRLRVFQIEHATWPTPVTGAMRLCMPDDRETLAQYLADFDEEIGEASLDPSIKLADRLIADRKIFFWTDPHPVAIAGWAGPTPNGIRINSVYTPRKHRSKGYASNLVAHLTHHLLTQGRKYCFLFTDQANPTSNSIYQKLGYRPISDSIRWEFSTL